jgi:hypothetical protein
MMNEKTNPERNRPAEKGGKNDPNVRDNSAAQPGVNTMSESPGDKANEEITKTGSGNFGEDVNRDSADKTFGEEED